MSAEPNITYFALYNGLKNSCEYCLYDLQINITVNIVLGLSKRRPFDDFGRHPLRAVFIRVVDQDLQFIDIRQIIQIITLPLAIR